jgi:hypothetical protein
MLQYTNAALVVSTNAAGNMAKYLARENIPLANYLLTVSPFVIGRFYSVILSIVVLVFNFLT